MSLAAEPRTKKGGCCRTRKVILMLLDLKPGRVRELPHLGVKLIAVRVCTARRDSSVPLARPAFVVSVLWSSS